MTFIGAKDLALEIAKGNVPGHSCVNKFGRSTNVDNGIDTDVHDGANATDGLNIWVAPTTARIHDIASTSTSDDGDPVGVGARTIRIFGLTAWNTAEVSEDKTMNGTTDVPTSNAYVIIHRMEVLTKGPTNINVGVITATAQTDNTVTAQINVGEGQTQMAIYGIPSIQKAYMTSYYASFNKSLGVAGSMDISLLANRTPDTELINFTVKHTQGIISTGTSQLPHPFNPYLKIEGPAIIKIQAVSTANNLDASAGFDLILVDN